jgi:amidohydrolase
MNTFFTSSHNRLWVRSCYILIVAALFPAFCWAQSSGGNPLSQDIDKLSRAIEPKVIEWRRDIHQNPELSGKEFRTTKMVVEHLQRLGLEVRPSPSGTGVVAILRGQKASPVVALRADMDALPITELTDVPFASKTKGVMHACGHDGHTSILMGTAEVLSKLKDRLPGTVKFIFQPSEENVKGAKLMIQEGALDSPKVEAIFGLHVYPAGPAGTLAFRSGGTNAGVDYLRIVVKGRGTHGGMPWLGIDPIVAASQIVLGLQTVVSRQTDLMASPAGITIGKIHGGVTSSIIPGEVEMEGTLRTFDPKIQKELRERIERTAKGIAASSGATADVLFTEGCPVVYNDPKLTARMAPTLQRVAGEGKLLPASLVGAGEDFAFYQEKIPGMLFNLGIRPNNAPLIPVHSPNFTLDESALVLGVRAMCNLTVDFLDNKNVSK